MSSKLYHKLICSDMFTISWRKYKIMMQNSVKCNESLNQYLFLQTPKKITASFALWFLLYFSS